ncbi:TetR/AcrR family transcriptional regulator [Actinacidiphila yanglinensis]|uniref:TetR/AcrR family transcriptional regulator n=1 Tax=Actinacidiphila yanglinensis TaxID=310779 RepID=UPI000CDECF68|nr:TetR/AcrR family transcriptional regulator [Actinacidiphila yanglinensis]
MSAVDADGPRPPRTRDPEGTKAEILRVAREEFARLGFHGARVDEIAARTRTAKRMIYYYFGSKEELFVRVLETAYEQIRMAESNLDIEHLEPEAAIRRLAALTLQHHEDNEDFIRLVALENIYEAAHMRASPEFAASNSPALTVVERILEAGCASGVFRKDADAVDVHAMISSFCFFRVSNRHTFAALFGRDLAAPELREHHSALLGDMVVAYLKSAAPS